MTHTRRKEVVLIVLSNLQRHKPVRGRRYVFDDAQAQEIADKCVLDMDKYRHTTMTAHVDALEDTLCKHLASYEVRT